LALVSCFYVGIGVNTPISLLIGLLIGLRISLLISFLIGPLFPRENQVSFLIGFLIVLRCLVIRSQSDVLFNPPVKPQASSDFTEAASGIITVIMYAVADQ
jgi:hypothetical protein